MDRRWNRNVVSLLSSVIIIIISSSSSSETAVIKLLQTAVPLRDLFVDNHAISKKGKTRN